AGCQSTTPGPSLTGSSPATPPQACKLHPQPFPEQAVGLLLKMMDGAWCFLLFFLRKKLILSHKYDYTRTLT
uniref:Uncharacterized protein n=1 Tax=Strix occidentalis caurina TaxID=311401 RepID=A0A8D0FF49_STROC